MELTGLLHHIGEHGAGFDFIYSLQNQPDMNKNMILKSDVLDIIFEKRNKSYGAYDLRKFYPDRLKLALGLMLIAAITFSAFTFLPAKDKRVMKKPFDVIEMELTKVKDKPKDPEKKKDIVKAEKKTPAKATPVAQAKLTSSIKIVAQNEKADTIKTILPTVAIGSTNIVTATPGVAVVEPVKTDPGNGGQVDVAAKIDKASPMDGDAVDVLPSYPGGMDALRKFLQKHLQTPDELESGESVSVRVKFVVDYTGKLKSFVTGPGADAYNNEVVRVLKKMPDWIPGKTKGEDVSVYYVIPVKFETTD
jgi:periplasmic protein TonB